MRAYGEDWEIVTSRHWQNIGMGKAFNLNLYQSKQSGYKVWFADFKDKKETGEIVTRWYYKIGIEGEIDMQQAFKIANRIALAGEAEYPD